MEILRFEEAAPVAPKRKKSSKGYLTAGFVAALFSVGSAFATTSVQINSGEGVSLGQGVTLATACDTAISIVPITTMTVKSDVPTFFLSELLVNGIDADTGTPASGATPATYGCGGKFFDMQVFNTDATPAPYTCDALQSDGLAEVFEVGGDEKTITCGDSKLSFQISTAYEGDRNYRIVLKEAPSDISYITLVTRNNA